MNAPQNIFLCIAEFYTAAPLGCTAKFRDG